MQAIKKLFSWFKLPSAALIFLLLVALLVGIGFAVDQPISLVNLPALAIVLVGTALATALSFSFQEIRTAFARLRSLEDVKTSEMTNSANQILHFSQLWFRKLYTLIDRDIETLGSHAANSKALKSDVLKKGLQMVRDRQPVEDIQALMSWKLMQEKNRDSQSIRVLQAMSSYAPVFGLIGTLVGVISLLQGFEPASGFEAMIIGLSVAAVSTLYGLLLSQLVFKPLVLKLERSRAQHVQALAMLAEGVVMIAKQRRPAEIRDILLDYIDSLADPQNSKSKNTQNPSTMRKPALLKFGASS